MKKVLLLSAISIVGLMSAKSTEVKNVKELPVHEAKVNVSTTSKAIIAEPIRMTTFCGKSYWTVNGSQEVLYQEWLDMNAELCSENPMV
ncbi:hypothetical protein [Chryseobacterium oryctis]|uniref:Uncharacterized protein n=1 Tax=Chryseobacterium oryctis TaxID=2952618 RepID=A0ABT3HJ18_9FLAO|nr:hypothetical protein [Chryseobacterium oryctis]MCW3159769.1 hypothetical protein [Chryseobacterium oryctis]